MRTFLGPAGEVVVNSQDGDSSIPTAEMVREMVNRIHQLLLPLPTKRVVQIAWLDFTGALVLAAAIDQTTPDVEIFLLYPRSSAKVTTG